MNFVRLVPAISLLTVIACGEAHTTFRADRLPALDDADKVALVAEAGAPLFDGMDVLHHPVTTARYQSEASNGRGHRDPRDRHCEDTGSSPRPSSVYPCRRGFVDAGTRRRCQSLELQGRTDEAVEVRTTFDELWSLADVPLTGSRF